jgi:hypothetical protein
VVIASPEQLVFVEVKYWAPNPVQRDYRNFARYTDRADLFAVSPPQVAAAAALVTSIGGQGQDPRCPIARE